MTNATLIKVFEAELQEKINAFNQKELPEEMRECYEKIVNIQFEEVKRLAIQTKEDLNQMLAKMQETGTEQIQYLDYFRYYQRDGNTYEKYAAGMHCTCDTNWITFEMSNLTIECSREIGISMLDLDVVDFYFHRQYPDTSEALNELARAQQKNYMQKACLLLEQEGFFETLIQKNKLKLPFYISMGIDSDAGGGYKNPVAYVLNPS
ncbi:MAG: hypothetical protein AAGL34_05060 [Bacteroidota bacterium]